MEFKFTIGDETYSFSCEVSQLETTFKKEFPTFYLMPNYCMCMDACNCQNGHYVTGQKWVSKDPAKPWEGETVGYEEPLYIKRFVKGAGAEWVHYYDYESHYN